MAFFKNSTQAEKSTTIISKGTKIKGETSLTAKLHIEGEWEGKIESTNIVSIGKGGVVKGELKASRLIINGEFIGKAECEEIEIMKDGVLKGDIIVENLIIEKGGVFQGSSILKSKDKIQNANPKSHKLENKKTNA